jgi:hypothetical protein
LTALIVAFVGAIFFWPAIPVGWYLGRQALRENPNDDAARVAVSIGWVAGAVVCALLVAGLIGLVYALAVYG